MKMPGGVSQGEVTRCQPRAEGCHLISVAWVWILTHRHQANEPWAVIEGVDILCLKKLLKAEIWYLARSDMSRENLESRTTRRQFMLDFITVYNYNSCEHRSVVEWTCLQDRWTAYQSAHMTTSKRPSIVDTSRSLSHLTTLRRNQDCEFCTNDEQIKRGKKKAWEITLSLADFWD